MSIHVLCRLGVVYIAAKWTILLAVIWLIGLYVCASRVIYWQDEGERALAQLSDESYNPEEWYNYQRLVVQQANDNVAMWLVAANIWTFIMLIAIFFVYRWENRDEEECEPST